MKSQGISANFTDSNVEALAAAVFKSEKPTTVALKELDRVTGGLLAAALKAGEFKGESGETALIRFPRKGKVKATRLLLIGMGDREEYKVAAVSIVSGTAARFFRQLNIKSFALLPRCDARGRCRARGSESDTATEAEEPRADSCDRQASEERGHSPPVASRHPGDYGRFSRTGFVGAGTRRLHSPGVRTRPNWWLTS